MYRLSLTRPFPGLFHRPPLRVLLFLFIFSIFFTVFLLPTHAPHFPEHNRPLSFDPPQPGSNRHRIRIQRPITRPDAHRNKDVWAQRADAVRDAFLQAYNSYVTYASPYDELLPLSKAPSDTFNGWALSHIESLDTLWLMGLYEQFDSALAVIANTTFSMPPTKPARFFETVIRYLGGLLSAYALSHDPILLSRADDLGAALLPTFNTTSGLPAYGVYIGNGELAQGWIGNTSLWSEMLTCQLEYKYLAYLTGRTPYYTAVEDVMEIMYAANLTLYGDLFPVLWSINTGLPTSQKVSVGAFADSAYEYMLKQWLLSGRTDAKARDLYLRSANAILDRLTYISPKRHLLYVTDANVGPDSDFSPTHIFEHLTCFLPGMLALGAAMLPDTPPTHMWAAQGLAQTCWTLYADSPTGLSPDEVIISTGSASDDGSQWDGLWATHLAQWEQSGARGDPPGLRVAEPVLDANQREYQPTKAAYLLRPETVESLYLLWRTTGDVVWRERGWAIFAALLNETRVEDSGFASIRDVYRVGGRKLDEMPSWFLAETLKYLFLLFTDDDLIPLDQWVFNTEAHPLPVIHWSEWEMERYGIAHAIT